MERFKARLVIKRCSQKPGVDYQETYAPVVRYNSIRLLLALAAKHHMDVDHLDVVTAFLHGDLDKKNYMEQSSRISVKGQESKCCRLRKALYGLKQGSRAWNIKLDGALKEFGFERFKADQCVYYLPGEMFYIAAYVDDLILFSKNATLKEKMKNHLAYKFEMKDLGAAENLLGMRITRDRVQGKIWLDQENYVKELLLKYNMQDSHPVKTPMDPNQKLSNEFAPTTKEEIAEMSRTPYREVVGSLMYARQSTITGRTSLTLFLL